MLAILIHVSVPLFVHHGLNSTTLQVHTHSVDIYRICEL